MPQPRHAGTRQREGSLDAVVYLVKCFSVATAEDDSDGTPIWRDAACAKLAATGDGAFAAQDVGNLGNARFGVGNELDDCDKRYQLPETSQRS